MGIFMEWFSYFQLFMFDFDGLLVNTENLHYEAYRTMCAARGVNLTWDFAHYCKFAHYDSAGFQEALFADFPELKSSGAEWEILYEEKKRALIDSVKQGKTELMPVWKSYC